jgi:hypothetical protein
VPEQFGVGAASLFEGVGEDGEASGVEGAGREGAVFVGGLGQGDHLGRPPGGRESDRAEGVAENVTEQVGVGLGLDGKITKAEADQEGRGVASP